MVWRGWRPVINNPLRSRRYSSRRTEELSFALERNLGGSNQFGLQLVGLSLTE